MEDWVDIIVWIGCSSKIEILWSLKSYALQRCYRTFGFSGRLIPAKKAFYSHRTNKSIFPLLAMGVLHEQGILWKLKFTHAATWSTGLLKELLEELKHRQLISEFNEQEDAIIPVFFCRNKFNNDKYNGFLVHPDLITERIIRRSESTAISSQPQERSVWFQLFFGCRMFPDFLTKNHTAMVPFK